MNWMPSQARGFLFVRFKETNISHHTQVKDPWCRVSCARRQKLATPWFEFGLGDGIFMSMKRSQTSACPGIPEFDLMVFGAGDQQAFRRMPVYRFSIPSMTGQYRFLDASSKIENLESRIITSSHEFAIVGRESKVTDGIVMGLKCFDIIEVWLPILYNSVLICRNQPIFVV